MSGLSAADRRRQSNVEVFRDTQEMIAGDPAILRRCRKSLAGQVCLPEGTPLETAGRRYDARARVVVSRKRTLEAALPYVRAGQRVCVLNFASATTPGGGVTWGSSAQEECLCRVSTLYGLLSDPMLRNVFYSPHRASGGYLYNDDLIYTPGVLVLKTDEDHPQRMGPEDWYEVDVVSCAAPNLRSSRGDGIVPISDERLSGLHKKRLRRILDATLALGQPDVMILGAFGCGAFRNDPWVVAKAMSQVIPDFLDAFRAIEFAVYCPPHGSDENYRAFGERLAPLVR